MKIIFFIACIALFSGCRSSAPASGSHDAVSSGMKPVAETKTYTNPVIMNAPDPGIYYHEPTGVYYVYATFRRAFKSTDLVNWTELAWSSLGEGLSRDGEFWAPMIFRRQKDGMIYIFYTLDQRLHIARAPTPEGPFAHHAGPILEHWSIDSSYFRDDDGREFIYWNEGGCEGTSGIWVAELNEDLTGVMNPEHGFNNAQVGSWLTQCVVEAPYMILHNDLYYLTFSGNSTGPDYMLAYATAPTPRGPWEMHPGNPVMRSTGEVIGPGHANFTRSPDGSEMLMFYHSHRPDLPGRHTCLDRVSFEPDPNGGPDVFTIQGPTTTPQPLPSPRTN